ncbi:MAG TPA: phosphatidate cytidylyltransferase [Solirubrobacteraceae bacterium]|nr:phosphatidate cytidylyltransferase [Solirubrobacteraceae bacterium]
MAVPAVVVLLALVVLGGLPFALAVAALGVLAAVELSGAFGASPAVGAVGAGAVAVLVVGALAGGREVLVGLLAALLPLLLVAAALGAPGRAGAAPSVAAGVLAATWIGLGLAHGVLLRELPAGEALVVAVVLGTLLGDTAAHLVGTAWGRRPLAPAISPAKSLEGVVAGLVVATLAVLAFAALAVDGLGAGGALALGLAVALAAPAGDLFESLLKRDLGLKDSGTLFGAHGGALDRIDALLFTAVAGYYATLAVL